MKVLQLIDALAPGGAERLAVTMANELSAHGFESYLCASRAEGLLKDSLSSEVLYLYLRKQHALDIFAFIRLFRFVKHNRVDVIHAHSSSFFWGTMVTILRSRTKLIWHDHYGDSEYLAERKFGVLRWCSAYFSGIISVNENLRKWALEQLKCKEVRFIRNFVTMGARSGSGLQLKGNHAYRIICLANLRPQKDHYTLFNAFKQIQESIPEATLHLVGNNSDQQYYSALTKTVAELDLKEVYFHGPQKEIAFILKQGSLGILSSQSEGLPLALLEYGMSGLPVVCTRVGECEAVVQDFGQVVPAGNSEALAAAVLYYFSAPDRAQQDAERYRDHIHKNYSFQAILPQLKEMYTH